MLAVLETAVHLSISFHFVTLLPYCTDRLHIIKLFSSSARRLYHTLLLRSTPNFVIMPPELNPEITEKLNKIPTLTPYLKFIIYSVKMPMNQHIESLSSFSTEEVVRYFNKSPRLTAVGSPLEKDYVKALHQQVKSGPSEDRNLYAYIWNHKCTSTYKFGLLEGITQAMRYNMGEDDKLIDGWLKEKDIINEDLIRYLKFILYTTEGFKLEEIVSYFNESQRVTQCSYRFTPNDGRNFYDEVINDASESGRYYFIYKKKCSDGYKTTIEHNIRNHTYENIEEEILVDRWLRDQNIMKNSGKTKGKEVQRGRRRERK